MFLPTHARGRVRLIALWLLTILGSFALTGSAGQQRSAAQLSKAGWEALNAGRIQEAATAFDEALRAGPQTPSTLLGAGLAARLQGRTDEVRRLLVDALKIEPSLTAASLLLGSGLYQSGDLDGAVDTYQRALAFRPDHPQLTKQLEAWRKEAELHSGFRQTLGDHFTVMFEGPAEADLASRAVAVLEGAYWRIGTALAIYPLGVTTVILYTREQFHDITRSPSWAGGSFDGRIRVPVQGALQNRAEFERVLAHEFTHALIQSVAARGVPTWLHEGLADCFDGSDIRKKEQQIRQSEAHVPLSRLEDSFEGLTAKEATLAYAESAVVVHRLLEDPGPLAIANLLTDIGRGTPFAEAFERNIFISYEEFQKKQSEF
jgi:Peptidase MA superfamily/Tetratricopeptide repeat